MMSTTSDATYPQLLQQAKSAANEKNYNEAASLYRQFLSQTESHRNKTEIQTLRIETFNNLIRILDGLSDFKASLKVAKQHLTEAESNPERINALCKLSNTSVFCGYVEDARHYIQQALELADEHGDANLIALTNERAAIVYMELDEFQEGILRAKKALVVFEQEQVDIKQAHLWNTLGLIYGKMGNIYQAMVCNRIFLKFAKKLEGLNSETAIIVALNNLGENYQALFALDESKRHLQEAMELLKALPYNAKALMGEIYRNYGMTLCMQGDTKHGIEHIYRGFDLNHEAGNHSINTQALYSLAWSEIQWGDRENGYLHARRLLHLARNKQIEQNEAYAYYVLGLYHFLEGEKMQAGQEWQKSLTIAKRKHLRTLIWQLHMYMAQIGMSPEVKHFHEERARSEINEIAQSIGDLQLRTQFLQAPAIKQIRP